MRPKPGPLEWRLQQAESLGYVRGIADKHYEPRTFSTGAEYIAWLRGWRKGQQAIKAQREREAKQLADVERVMQRMLTDEAA